MMNRRRANRPTTPVALNTAHGEIFADAIYAVGGTVRATADGTVTVQYPAAAESAVAAAFAALESADQNLDR